MTIWPAILVYGSFFLFLVATGAGIAYFVKRRRQSEVPEVAGGDTERPVSLTGSESNTPSP